MMHEQTTSQFPLVHIVTPFPNKYSSDGHLTIGILLCLKDNLQCARKDCVQISMNKALSTEFFNFRLGNRQSCVVGGFAGGGAATGGFAGGGAATGGLAGAATGGLAGAATGGFAGAATGGLAAGGFATGATTRP
ncbi:hypothetical protein DL96DRAFT_268469 [Flagelloscypha sp. PMI_526]|nr:hypothetical protein DL96DRAFT_268469 [Flagelloscypha sp. PMI_526]